MQVKEKNDITSEVKKKINEIVSSYSQTKGGLIPALHEVQQILGYLPYWIQQQISDSMNIPVSEINSIISFYSLFSENPKGKYCIGICKGTACYVRGSQKIIDRFCKELQIEPGEVTDDGLFSIEVLRCLGACGLGPVITVNEKVYTRVKPDKVTDILNEIKKKEIGGN